MSQKAQTDQILAESLKELMRKRPFEKITIKDITDKAGVIRPTFYNHFKDKNDLLDWIFRKEIIQPASRLAELGMLQEGVKVMLLELEKEKEFYLSAIRVTGQNSFREIMLRAFSDMCYDILTKHISEKNEKEWMKDWMFHPRNIADYYGNAETFVLMKWMEHGMKTSVDDVARIHDALHRLSFEDLIEEIEKTE